MTLEETLRRMADDEAFRNEHANMCTHAAEYVKECLFRREEVAGLNKELTELRKLRDAVRLLGRVMKEGEGTWIGPGETG